MFSLVAECRPCVILISCETLGDINADKDLTLARDSHTRLAFNCLSFLLSPKNGINEFISSDTHHAWHHREIHPSLRSYFVQFINWRNFVWYETGTTTSLQPQINSFQLNLIKSIRRHRKVDFSLLLPTICFFAQSLSFKAPMMTKRKKLWITCWRFWQHFRFQLSCTISAPLWEWMFHRLEFIFLSLQLSTLRNSPEILFLLQNASRRARQIRTSNRSQPRFSSDWMNVTKETLFSVKRSVEKKIYGTRRHNANGMREVGRDGC